jgi:DNA replication and repair protein RecF
MERRLACVEALNTSIATIYPHFTEQTNPETLVLQYKPAVEIDNLAKKLHQTRGYDMKTGNTNYGPHRDDVAFLMADRDVTLFASRGELRRCVLTTKLAEAEYLKTAQARTPYVLLDDVFSELDEIRRQRFIEAMLDYRTVVTTTDQAFIATQELPNAIQYILPLQTDTSKDS